MRARGQEMLISIARMHRESSPVLDPSQFTFPDIRSRTKFRRLQQHADHANVAGLAKTGKPGVLVFEGEKTCIAAFLEGARSLRYLDFHHVSTRVLPPDPEVHIAGTSKAGLREVPDMKTLIQALEAVGLKDWFRTEMRMRGP
ncbi:hypothetical protein C8R46DRAFT_509922 [Mycena filopes]|nr:hypothetical protein C8R46DRAFT_509922 [Mycena filopes]